MKSHCLTLARICMNELAYGYIRKCRYSILLQNIRSKETTHPSNTNFLELNDSCKLPVPTGPIVPLNIYKNEFQVAGFHGLAGIRGVLPHASEVNLQQHRHKSKKRKYSRHGPQEGDSDDSDEDELFELEEGDGFHEIKVRLPSLRLDAVMKAGFSMSRSKAEAAFYGNKVMVNGRKALKSKQLHEGDDVDLIRGSDAENQDSLTVSRVTIMVVGNYSSDTDKVSVKLRKYPNLVVDKDD